MLQTYLQNFHWHCLGYCSNIRTEVAGHIGYPSLCCWHACEVDAGLTL